MRVCIIAPHCSTGGMPAYVLAFIRYLLEAGDEVHFAEYADYGAAYTVQRDQIRALVPWTCHLGQPRSLETFLTTREFDVLHWQEEPSSFLPADLLSRLLLQRTRWRWVLTSHERFLDLAQLPYVADTTVAVCPWQERQFRAQLPEAHLQVWEYPVSRVPVTEAERVQAREALGLDPNKQHLVQVGLWSAHKRQHWTLQAAACLPPEWQVHFLGNRAPNMQAYWLPLMEALPDNCTVWDERDDVSQFLTAAHAFVLPSSKELAPISLREAASAGLPCYVSPLDVYEGSTIPLTFIDPERPESLAEALANGLREVRTQANAKVCGPKEGS